MVTARMLPAVAPVAQLYSCTVRTSRTLRLTAFTAGYLLVWAFAAVPAFLLAQAVARLAQARPVLTAAVAVAAYAVCGVYQLTPYKERCLRHCRSPLALLLHYGSYRGAAA
jgi:predicted metal-binding membrane protein